MKSIIWNFTTSYMIVHDPEFQGENNGSAWIGLGWKYDSVHNAFIYMTQKIDPNEALKKLPPGYPKSRLSPATMNEEFKPSSCFWRRDIKGHTKISTENAV